VKRTAIVVSSLRTIWAVAAFMIGPALIRSAHAGESFELINRAIRSESGIPLEAYLALWWRYALVATAVLVGIGVLIVATTPLHGRIAAPLRKIRSGLPGNAFVAVLLLAVTAGCTAGLAEAVIQLVRERMEA